MKRWLTSQPERRLRAIRFVASQRAAAAVPALVRLLSDRSCAYRTDVVRALGRIPVADARSALLTALADPSDDVRREVIAALGAALGEYGPPIEDAGRIIERLQSVVSDDPAPLVRYAAYRAVMTSGDWSAMTRALGRASRDPHELLRCAAVMDRAGLARLSGNADSLRDNAVGFRRILAETAPARRFTVVHGAYRARWPCPGLRVAVVQGLGRMKQPDDVPRLVEIVHSDPDGAVRVAAIGALVECGGDAALTGVIAALDDPIVAVRVAAVDALASFDDSRAGDALEGVLRHGGSLDRQHAANALLMVAGRSPSLVDALADDTMQVRRAAEASLVAQQERDSIAPLIDLLSDPRPALRVRAAAVLARYRGAASRAHLLAVLRVGASPSAPLAAMALGLRGEPEARPELEAALARGDFPDRVAVVHALQDLRQRESLPALIAFAERTPDGEAKAAAVRAVALLSAMSG